jgi:large subunit ribosomal protein L10
MDRNQKSSVVSSLKEDLKDSSLVVIAHYRGLSAQNMSKLRNIVRKNGAKTQVVKNTLIKLAVKGTNNEGLADHLEGPVVIFYSSEPVGLSKAITDFSKENEIFKVKIGCLDGEVVNENTLKSLAKLGSLEDVRAGLVGMLKAVPTNFVRLLNAPSSKLVTIFENYVSSKN